ncbi:hypothetical protein [Seonamhaeicola sp. ML3]|uniref:hypothetical protein n=1 Tax=Seonamhaeicola sp. ML3 TaxID=2937786 RepID=UPI00200E4D5F|nr:hypothetical protein [Seonamhaeicola sp. ML3]
MSGLSNGSSRNLSINKDFFINLLLFIWLLIIAFLAWADVFINHYEWIDSGPIQRLVSISKDDGLPNWFSSVQLFCVSMVLWSIFVVESYSKPVIENKRVFKYGWSFCAMFFSYLAIDDGSKMHERVGTTARVLLESKHKSDPNFITKLFDVFPSYGWQFVYVPIFGVVALLLLFFLYKKLKEKKQFIFIILGFGCFAGSVFLDFFEDMDASVYDPVVNFFNTELYNIEHFSRLIEEILEMIGNTFFMLAFTKQLISYSNQWNIHFYSKVNKVEDEKD